MKYTSIIVNIVIWLTGYCSYSNSCINQPLQNTESVFVHLNSTNLLSGETLYYKLYALQSNNTPSLFSKIAYIEIFDPWQNSVIKQKIVLNNGIATGDIFISSNLKSGSYKLLAYTNEMFKNSIVFQTDLLIINPYDKLVIPGNNIIIDSTSIKENPSISATSNNTNKEILLNQSNFNKRSKIDFKLSEVLQSDADFMSGNYSISVRKQGLLDNLTSTTLTDKFKDENIFSNNRLTNYVKISEPRGSVVSGKIEGTDVSGLSLGLSIPGNPFEFKIATTDEQGNFYFTMADQLSSNEIFIQPLTPIKGTITIDSLYLKKDVLPEFVSYFLNESMRKEITDRSIANQVENVYYNIRKDSIITYNYNNENFYSPLQKTYLLDDYNRFLKVQETIVEIIPELYYKKRKDSYTLHSRDYVNEYSETMYGETLLFMDGVLIKDVSQFFNFDSRKIDKIEVVNSGYFYGNQLYNGIVSVYTKTGDFTPESNDSFPIYKGSILTTSPEKKYYQQTYNNSQFDRVPDYRYQLLWQPNFEFHNNGSYSFYSSDIAGTYTITVEGFKANGIPISLKSSFTVN